jgi:hypothetical protein
MQFMEQYQDTFVLNDARSTALWTEYVESVLKLQASEDVKKEKKVSRRRAKKKKRPVVPLVESYDTPLDQPLLPLPELYETPPDQLTGKTGQTVEPTADIRRIRNNKRKLSSRLLTKRVYNAHTTATSTSSVLASAVSRRQGELDLSAEHVVPLGRRARFRSRNRHNSHKAKTRARELFVRPTTAK